MKKLWMFTLPALFLFASFPKVAAAQAEVPAAVKEQFASLHPRVKKVAWEAEDEGYEAEYKMDGKEYSDTYSATGGLMETEEEIRKGELPAAITYTLQRDFADHEIEETAKITYPDGRIAYEVELEGKDDASFDALFNTDGTLLERIPLDEDND